MKKLITLSLVLFYYNLNFTMQQDGQLTPRTAQIVQLEQQIKRLDNQLNPKKESKTCCNQCCDCLLFTIIATGCLAAANEYIDERIDKKLPSKKMN